MTNTLQKNTKKESKVKGIAGRKENHTLTYIVLVIFTLIYILPILWMTISSFKSGTELFSYPPKLLPSVSRWKTTLMPGTAAISACTLEIRPLLLYRQRC